MGCQYTWCIDGNGKAYICTKKDDKWIVVFSMINGNSGIVGKLLIEGKI